VFGTGGLERSRRGGGEGVITHRESTAAAATRALLAQRAAARAGVDETTAQAVVAAFLDAVKESLLVGERVDLGGLLDLGVVVEPARIRREPGGRFAEIVPAQRRLDVQALGELRERLASQRAAAILLAMPRAGQFGEILGEHFVKLGWQVQRADTLDACRALLSGVRPYLLVCDHTLEARDAFVAELKTGWRTNPIPVVTLHTRGESVDRPKRLAVLSDLPVFEPIAVHPFLRSVDQLLARASEESAVFERQLRLRLPAVEAEILRAFEIADALFKDAGFRGDALTSLVTAFREAVRNAEVHGSRRDAARAIDLEFLLDAEKLTVSVQDEGRGFDHAAVRRSLAEAAPAQVARKRHRSGGAGGLGIYLMERCADRLEWNDRGNRVTLTKFRAAEEGPRAT
jgi:anti-sigma regulatory factor (Ser/Thr protein kinase)/nucleoid DNA-binding protein